MGITDRLDALEERQALFADFADKMTTGFKALDIRLHELTEVMHVSAMLVEAQAAIVDEIDGDWDTRVFEVFHRWEFGYIARLNANEVRVEDIGTTLLAIGQMLWDWHTPLPNPMRDEIARRLKALGFERRQKGIPLAT